METEQKTPEAPVEEDDEQPLLDLSEPLKRAVVKGPDGKAYELRTPEEFSVEDEHLLRNELEAFSQLQQKSSLKPSESTKLRLRLDGAFNRLFIGDEAAKKKFNDRQRQRVLLFFRTQWAVEDLAAVTGARNEIEKGLEAADGSTTES